jgi:hypothetical protein
MHNRQLVLLQYSWYSLNEAAGGTASESEESTTPRRPPSCGVIIAHRLLRAGFDGCLPLRPVRLRTVTTRRVLGVGRDCQNCLQVTDMRARSRGGRLMHARWE